MKVRPPVTWMFPDRVVPDVMPLVSPIPSVLFDKRAKAPVPLTVKALQSRIPLTLSVPLSVTAAPKLRKPEAPTVNVAPELIVVGPLKVTLAFKVTPLALLITKL